MTKVRRHSNNKGRKMLKNGTVAARTERLAKRLGVPFKLGKAKGELLHGPEKPIPDQS